jgi:hypothetical protein
MYFCHLNVSQLEQLCHKAIDRCALCHITKKKKETIYWRRKYRAATGPDFLQIQCTLKANYYFNVCRLSNLGDYKSCIPLGLAEANITS